MLASDYESFLTGYGFPLGCSSPNKDISEVGSFTVVRDCSYFMYFLRSCETVRAYYMFFNGPARLLIFHAFYGPARLFVHMSCYLWSCEIVSAYFMFFLRSCETVFICHFFYGPARLFSCHIFYGPARLFIFHVFFLTVLRDCSYFMFFLRSCKTVCAYFMFLYGPSRLFVHISFFLRSFETVSLCIFHYIFTFLKIRFWAYVCLHCLLLTFDSKLVKFTEVKWWWMVGKGLKLNKRPKVMVF